MSTQFSCIIVEDEPLQQQLLAEHIQQVPYLYLAGMASNVFEAQTLIEKTHPDLIFLDLKLPQINGFDWLRSLDHLLPNVIVVTANPDGALESYELNILYYLSKPVTFEKFLKAINRFRDRNLPPTNSFVPSPLDDTLQNQALFVKEGRGLVKLAYSKINFIEAEKNYAHFHLSKESILTVITLTALEEKLPSPPFFRLNRSTIIHQDYIERIVGHQLTLANGKQLQVTAGYLGNLTKLLELLQST